VNHRNTEIRDYFDDWAGNYDLTVKAGKWRAPRRVFEMARPYLKKNSRVLDVAIGTGMLSEYFRKLSAGVNITGLDISRGMLRQCADKGHIADSLIPCDVEHQRFPVPDRNYDLTIASGVFEFLATVKNVFTEMARVTRPGGIIAFSYIPNSLSKTGMHDDDGDVKVYSQSSRKIEQMMAGLGVHKLASSPQFIAYDPGHAYPNKVFLGQVL